MASSVTLYVPGYSGADADGNLDFNEGFATWIPSPPAFVQGANGANVKDEESSRDVEWVFTPWVSGGIIAMHNHTFKTGGAADGNLSVTLYPQGKVSDGADRVTPRTITIGAKDTFYVSCDSLDPATYALRWAYPSPLTAQDKLAGFSATYNEWLVWGVNTSGTHFEEVPTSVVVFE